MNNSKLNISTLPSCYACNSIHTKIAYNDSKYRVLSCLNCGLHFVNPVPVLNDVNSHLSDSMYSNTGKLTEIEKQKVRALITADEIIKLSKSSKISGNRILDIGCGYGFFLERLKSLGWDVYGCEQNMHVRDHAASLGLPVYSDFKETQLWKEGFYDVITLWNVLEHINNPLQLLSDCSQLLRKGGTILIRVPNFSSERFFWNIDRFRGKNISFMSYMEIPLHLFCFTKTSLIFMLRKMGYESVHQIPSPIGDKSYYLGKQLGALRTAMIVKCVEFLNLIILKLSISRLPGFLSITILAFKSEE